MVHSLNVTNYLNLILVGVEKNNDAAKRVLRRKSNNWDRPADVLQTEARLWALRSQERQPRAYKKKAETYWFSDIKESRAKRRRVSTEN